jgi:hypothetical protein
MKTPKEKIYETDLYEPVRKYFTKQGYEVYGEVHHCDIVAVKEDELIVIELKLNLTVDLLVQATTRQRLTDQVYIAIPKPKSKSSAKKWQNLYHLIRRLELGLIFVDFQKGRTKVDVKVKPSPFDRSKSLQRNKSKRNQLLKEISGRNGDYNVGGSTKTKIMTAYKENCIQIALYLNQNGPLSPKALRDLGTGEKTQSILRQNYYGWYEKVNRGIYSISEKGKMELQDYPELVKFYAETQTSGSLEDK